jgi:hypothetical protein
VPLNSPRLLIRLRRCRKSGTVPLNSPRLLIRHRIPSTGLRTDIHTKQQEESISLPDTDRLCNTNTQYYEIRDDTTSTGDTSQEDSIDLPPRGPNDINQDPVFLYLYYRQGPHPQVQPIISSKPLISLRSKHRHARSFNNFNSATCIHVIIAIPPILHFN